MNFFASFIIRSRHVTSFILFDIPLVPQISFKFVSQSYLALRHFQEKFFLLVMLRKKILVIEVQIRLRNRKKFIIILLPKTVSDQGLDIFNFYYCVILKIARNIGEFGPC